MNLEQSIAAVRALDALPEPRRVHLVRMLASAPTTGIWARIAAEARAEAIRAKQERSEPLDAAWETRTPEPPPTPRRAPITPEMAQEILRRRAEGERAMDIAEDFGISAAVVYHAIKRYSTKTPE